VDLDIVLEIHFWCIFCNVMYTFFSVHVQVSLLTVKPWPLNAHINSICNYKIIRAIIQDNGQNILV